jgi:hypothetical protein
VGVKFVLAVCVMFVCSVCFMEIDLILVLC